MRGERKRERREEEDEEEDKEEDKEEGGGVEDGGERVRGWGGRRGRE